MEIIQDNSCLIDVISKEAAVKNQAKLNKAKVKTIPYVVDLFNNNTHKRTGHACLIFHYDGDTWHYDNQCGSVKVFKGKLSNDILAIAKKVYTLYPHITLRSAFPLKMSTQFEGESKTLPKKYIA
jgi:hypothetical protein